MKSVIEFLAGASALYYKSGLSLFRIPDPGPLFCDIGVANPSLYFL